MGMRFWRWRVRAGRSPERNFQRGGLEGFGNRIAFALFSGLDSRSGDFATVPEAIRLVSGFNDVAMMRQTIEQRGGHLGITKDAGPLGKRQIGRDHHAGVLVEF